MSIVIRSNKNKRKTCLKIDVSTSFKEFGEPLYIMCITPEKHKFSVKSLIAWSIKPSFYFPLSGQASNVLEKILIGRFFLM